MHKPERGDLYQHFKGESYVVHMVATDCTNYSNNDEYVVYSTITDTQHIFIRKLSEFTSKVDANKYPAYEHHDRFKFLGNLKK